MRKIFIDNLPYKRKYIDWKHSVGCDICFIYDNIQGKFKIVDYYTKNKKGYLKIKYKSNIYNIFTSTFLKGHLGRIIGKYNKNYKYQVGDIITDVNSGKLEILEQIKITHHRKNKEDTYDKGYKYKCLICDNIDVIREYSLNNQYGCNVCSSNKIKIYKNDIWTTNPGLAKLLLNPKDGYKYAQNSNKKINWKCPNCDNIIKNKKITHINMYGLSCPKCGDKLPYPEKFVFNFLQQLNIEFTYQLSKTTFKWCNSYRYDFYFELNNENYIIETNGLGHYEDKFSSRGGRTLQEEQENDRNKKELALANRIKEENYIVIDCRYSKLEYIKDNILNSRLNDIFDLNQIDWLKCHKFACSSSVKKVCNLWNDEIHSIIKIGKMIKLSCSTIRKYLKQGAKLGWCDYDPNFIKYKDKTNYARIDAKKVMCLNNKKVFNSIKIANNYCNLKGNNRHIGECCRRKRKSAGKEPVTGEKLQWMYYDDYLKINKEKEVI